MSKKSLIVKIVQGIGQFLLNLFATLIGRIVGTILAIVWVSVLFYSMWYGKPFSFETAFVLFVVSLAIGFLINKFEKIF